MNNTLKTISDYLTAADSVSKKMGTITYSEMLQDLINANRTPFLDIVGLSERKSQIPGIDLRSGYRQQYNIVLYICKDDKVLSKVLKGTDSIFDLWNYIWSIIEKDRTFGGAVQGILDKDVESKITTLQRNDTVKLVYETNLTVYKDIFYK